MPITFPQHYVHRGGSNWGVVVFGITPLPRIALFTSHAPRLDRDGS